MRRFCIVGTGYVGVATAIGLAELGEKVAGYDIIRERVRGLQVGITPYREDGLGAALERHLRDGRLCFTDDLRAAVSEASVVIVAVGTPSRPDGSADLSFLHDAIAALAEIGMEGRTLVLRSTVPVGTSDAVAALLGGRVPVVYAPEFLREGTALRDFLDPDRIVIGAASRVAAEEFLAPFRVLGKPVHFMSTREAELVKGFSNAYLAMKISFANEVANLCDEVSADALTVLPAIGSDNRIGRPFLNPGIGYGGPCFDKDVRSMLSVFSTIGLPSELLAATARVNQRQPRTIVQKLVDEIGELAGKTIGVWGLTFKAGTDDLRDSLAVDIVNELLERGARVRAFDPAVTVPNTLVRCELVDDPLDALDGDALLVLTEWPMFCEVDTAVVAARLRSKVVVDGRNVLDHVSLARAGVRYRGVGRSNRQTRAFDDDADRLAG